MSEENSVQSLKIAENLSEASGLSTWYDQRHKEEETENTDDNEASDLICGNKQKIKSPLKASARLNGSTPQLSVTETDSSPIKQKSSTPPATPQESPRFVKLREKSAPSLAVSKLSNFFA